LSHERREREEGWRPGQSSAFLSHLPRRPQAEDDEDGAVVDEGDDRGRRIDEPVQAVAEAAEERKAGRARVPGPPPPAPFFTAGAGRAARGAEAGRLPLLHLLPQDGVKGELDGLARPLVPLVRLVGE